MSTRALIQQLVQAGFRAIVLMSGHGALDHLHVLREECDRLMKGHSGISAIATCWNELTVDVDGDIHDHGAKVETSYMMELCGDLVNLEDLSDDPNGTFVGVYGPNPRFTASKDWGARLSSRVVAALVERVDAALSGKPVDNWADLRALVQRLQTGDLVVVRDSGRVSKSGLRFELENVQPQSKYITALRSTTWDGTPIDSADLIFRNRTVGENREQMAHDLGPLSGFYIRRHQRVQIELPSFRPAPGAHTISLELELAGVMEVRAVGSLRVVAA
jgi:Creatinine amidohydrolase